MTGCCRAGPCEQVFRPRIARRTLERYRRRGLDELELAMLRSAVDAGKALDSEAVMRELREWLAQRRVAGSDAPSRSPL